MLYVHNFKFANDLLEAGGVCKTLWPQKSNMNGEFKRSQGEEKREKERASEKKEINQLIIITISVYGKNRLRNENLTKCSEQQKGKIDREREKKKTNHTSKEKYARYE